MLVLKVLTALVLSHCTTVQVRSYPKSCDHNRSKQPGPPRLNQGTIVKEKRYFKKIVKTHKVHNLSLELRFWSCKKNPYGTKPLPATANDRTYWLKGLLPQQLRCVSAFLQEGRNRGGPGPGGRGQGTPQILEHQFSRLCPSNFYLLPQIFRPSAISILWPSFRARITERTALWPLFSQYYIG